MSAYNTIDGAPEGYDEQVKCWDWHELTCRFLGLDDAVPGIDGHESYSVRYNCHSSFPTPPRYWHVKGGRITAINELEPQLGLPVYNKWGDLDAE